MKNKLGTCKIMKCTIHEARKPLNFLIPCSCSQLVPIQYHTCSSPYSRCSKWKRIGLACIVIWIYQNGTHLSQRKIIQRQDYGYEDTGGTSSHYVIDHRWIPRRRGKHINVGWLNWETKFQKKNDTTINGIYHERDIRTKKPPHVFAAIAEPTMTEQISVPDMNIHLGSHLHIKWDSFKEGKSQIFLMQ